jgi:hypothetical protein
MPTVQEIDDAFASLGMPPEPADLVLALQGYPEATAEQVITEYGNDLGVGVIDQMFYVSLGHFPQLTTLGSIGSTYLSPQVVDTLLHAHTPKLVGVLPPLSEEQLAKAFVSSKAFSETNDNGRPVDPNAPENQIVVENLFLHTLGHLPTHHTLTGFSGLTNLEAFIAFQSSEAAWSANVTLNTTFNNIYHDVQTETGIVGQAATAHPPMV